MRQDCRWPASHQATVDALIVPPSYHCLWHCDNGTHLDPPTADTLGSTTITCMSDSLWHDLSIHAFRGCVADRLNCSFLMWTWATLSAWSPTRTSAASV